MGVNLSGETPRDPSSRGMLGGLDRESRGLGGALGTGIRGIIGGIGDALRGVFDPSGIFAPVGQAAAEITDGQTRLNNRVDLLSPIQDYGSVYMPAGQEIFGKQRMPFTEQIGPMRGCQKHSKGIRFDDKGLWDIRAQITVSWIRLLTADVNWRVCVWDSAGKLFSQQKSCMSTGNAVTGTIVSSVVVPEAGYYVTVEIDSIAGTRGILGGPGWTRLSVQHISRQVRGAWQDGSGVSDGIANTPETDDGGAGKP